MALVKEGLLALGIGLMIVGVLFMIFSPEFPEPRPVNIFGWVAFIIGICVFAYWCYCQAKAS
jgi:xanthosine utilization system XapX-like protein